MARRYAVRITLTSQLGRCPNGHKVGDRWLVGRRTPEGICLGAFNSLLPYITALRYGGNFPWEEEEGEGTFCCPDPRVVNTFRLERLPGSDDSE
jgi:uncharacterized repeat protein (TIGR04076 family)